MRFNNIDEFLENKFIPNHLKYKKINDNEFIKIIRLADIINLKQSPETKEYILKYLNDQDITVIGYSDKIDFESEDYKDIRNYRGTTPKSISKEKTNELFELYQKTKDQNIRNQIIVGNMRLVEYVIKLMELDGYNNQDLKQAGFIGLIKAVDKYDISKGAFSTFAIHYIKGHIMLELCTQNGYKNSEYFLYNEKRKVENKYDEKLLDNPNLSKIIAKNISEKNKHKKGNGVITEEIYLRRILLHNPVSLEETLEKNENENIYNLGYEPEDTDLIKFYDSEAIKILRNQIETLEEKKQQMLKLRYGFEKEPKTLREIGNEMNISATWVSNQIESAIRELSAKEEIKSLRRYLHKDIK